MLVGKHSAPLCDGVDVPIAVDIAVIKSVQAHVAAQCGTLVQHEAQVTVIQLPFAGDAEPIAPGLVAGQFFAAAEPAFVAQLPAHGGKGPVEVTLRTVIARDHVGECFSIVQASVDAGRAEFIDAGRRVFQRELQLALGPANLWLADKNGTHRTDKVQQVRERAHIEER